MIVNIHPGGRMQEVAGAFGLRWGPRPFSPKFPEFLMLKSFLFNHIALLGIRIPDCLPPSPLPPSKTVS